MNIQVFYNSKQSAVVNGYAEGDELISEFTGEVELDRNQEKALATIWLLFNTQDDKRSWNSERKSVLGALPSRNLRPGDVVTLQGASYACTTFGWEQLVDVVA